MSKPSRPPCAGIAVGGQHRIGVGREHHTREVADQRLQRCAQPRERGWQLCVERGLRLLHAADHAAALEQGARPRLVDDHVGDEIGKADVVGADSEQNEVERAVRVALGAPAPADWRVALPCAGHVERRILRSPQSSSRARCGPSRPASMVAPVQASGRNVTAICGCSTASASAARI